MKTDTNTWSSWMHTGNLCAEMHKLLQNDYDSKLLFSWYEFIVWIQLNQLMNFMRMCRLCTHMYCMCGAWATCEMSIEHGHETHKENRSISPFLLSLRMFCDMHFEIDTSTLSHIRKKFMGFIRSAYGSIFPSSTHYVKNVKCAALPIFFWCGHKSSLNSISALKNVFTKTTAKRSDDLKIP